MAYGVQPTNFATGLASGFDIGLDIAEWADKQRSSVASRNAQQILADWEGYDGAQQGIAEPGQAVSDNDYREQFMRAAANVSDPRDYALLTDNFNKAYSGKIDRELQRALMADLNGDTATAQEAFRRANDFAGMGRTTSEVQRDPKSGAYVVANYDGSGKPVGGYAATRENVENLRALVTGDPQDWLQLAEARDVKAARWHAQNRADKSAAAANARANASELRAVEKHQADMRGKDAANETAEFNLNLLKEYGGANAYHEAAKAQSDAITADVAADIATATKGAETDAALATSAKETFDAIKAPAAEASKIFSNLTMIEPEAPELEGKQADIMGVAPVTDSEGNKKYPDPFFSYSPKPGFSVPNHRQAAANSLIADMYATDYSIDGSFNIPEEMAAGLAMGAIGRQQTTQLQVDDDGEGGDIYSLVSPMLDQVEISEKAAIAMAKYRIDNYDALMAVQMDDEGRARVEANYQQALDMTGQGPQPTAAAPQGAIPADFPVNGVPATVPGAPAGAAAAAPSMAPAPAAEALPTDAMPAGFAPPGLREALGQTGMDPTARYPQTPAGPPQVGIDPFARYDTPPGGRSVDDTVSRIVPEGPRNPLGNREPVIRNTPALASAVETWVAADQPQEGPIADAVTKQLRKLSPRDRDTALRELQLLQGAQ